LSYLLLGWLPAIPLATQVPRDLAWWMVAGGVLYTIGVVFLLNDSKLRYLHAVWHLAVMAAAVAHFLGIMYYVVGA
ncbi:MAG: hemolysin III family protein, partial [Planctomycetota bacterium]|nr:hemolysin III family protein [Planctomycetota bacterium]